jgi:hypothetical protein
MLTGGQHRRTSVWLDGGAQLGRTVLHELVASHAEQTQGIVVAIDEFALVCVKNHNRFWGVLHQRAVSLFAFAKGGDGRLLRLSKRPFLSCPVQRDRKAGELVFQHITGYAHLDAVDRKLLPKRSR